MVSHFCESRPGCGIHYCATTSLWATARTTVLFPKHKGIKYISNQSLYTMTDKACPHISQSHTYVNFINESWKCEYLKIQRYWETHGEEVVPSFLWMCVLIASVQLHYTTIFFFFNNFSCRHVLTQPSSNLHMGDKASMNLQGKL